MSGNARKRRRRNLDSPLFHHRLPQNAVPPSKRWGRSGEPVTEGCGIFARSLSGSFYLEPIRQEAVRRLLGSYFAQLQENGCHRFHPFPFFCP
ncbi:MAG: hypothetical protein MJ077_07100 [Oscillospiraceae bacterium]|nr:hypothetical protein [Oscillospiraceae bacterium]